MLSNGQLYLSLNPISPFYFVLCLHHLIKHHTYQNNVSEKKLNCYFHVHKLYGLLSLVVFNILCQLIGLRDAQIADMTLFLDVSLRESP